VQKWANGANSGITVAGGNGIGNEDNQLISPNGVYVDASGNIYVSDAGNNRIQKYTYNSLPVTLSSFTATSNNITVKTMWKTTNEINTNCFNIQHSTDCNSFKKIGTINAISGNANVYEFTDTKPANGINYYRLQSVDNDGKSSYSKVVSVTFGDKQTFSIIPNPAKDYATISFSKTVDNGTIAVYDMTGKQVIKQSLNGNTYKLNTQSLKSGLYVIKVKTATGNYNQELIINK